MPNPLENKLLLSYMSGLGGAMGGEDSAAQAIGGITQQYIGAESKHKLQLQYIQMLKQMFAGGGKMNMDKDNISFKAPISVFGGESSELAGAFQIPGYGQTQAGVAGTKVPEVPNYVNPSASPLDVGSADLAGLTAKDVTEALQSALGVGELGRKKISDISEAAYYGTARRKMEAETAALIPSVFVPEIGQTLTNKQYIDWYKAANKDERSAAIKLYEYYVDQEKKAGRTPKSIEDWTIQVAEASGKSIAEIVAEFVAKKEAGTALDLAGPDFAQDIKKDLMKDRSTWGYPPAYEGLVGKGYGESEALDMSQKVMVLNEMDTRIKSFYKGKSVERKKDGWYVDGKLKVRNPYGR